MQLSAATPLHVTPSAPTIRPLCTPLGPDQRLPIGLLLLAAGLLAAHLVVGASPPNATSFRATLPSGSTPRPRTVSQLTNKHGLRSATSLPTDAKLEAALRRDEAYPPVDVATDFNTVRSAHAHRDDPVATPRRPLLLGTAGFVASLSFGLGFFLCGSAASAAEPRNPFQTVPGLFVQEKGNMPGSEPPLAYGAQVPWPQVHAALAARPKAKLVFFVRHAEGYHNAANRDASFAALRKARASAFCSWKNDNDLFDAQLTSVGIEQAKALNVKLRQPDGLQTLVPPGQTLRVITSPLSRTIQTATYVFANTNVGKFSVSELCRETLGFPSPEARRSLTNPAPDAVLKPCPYDAGLQQLYGDIVDFRMVDTDLKLPVGAEQYAAYEQRGLPLGLFADRDPSWTEEGPVTLLESGKEMQLRVKLFLASLFDDVPEQTVAVVTHSMFLAALTEVVGQRRYFPRNCEVIPMIIEDCREAPEGGEREV